MIRKHKGFTLIELVVVMALIAVLAALGVGAIIVARNTAKDTTNKSNARALRVGFEAFFAKNGQYPTAASGATFDATATILNVKLNTSTCPAAKLGGGLVDYTTSAYTITPYLVNGTTDCSLAATATSGLITGP